MLLKVWEWAQAHKSVDEGATAVEYGIMVAAIAVAILAVVFLIGDELALLFQDVLTKLQSR
ncbi:MAG: Flp family type IVb pilin [Coriobacteriia bacterium]